MRYDRSPILRERVACGGTNSSEFFAFDTTGAPISSWESIDDTYDFCIANAA